MKIKKGDKVRVISGDDRGKTAKVVKVFPRQSRVEVEGVNLHQKHLKGRGQNRPGGIVDLALPISLAQVMLVCPKCQQATRVKFAVSKSKSGSKSEKHRLCAKCGEVVS